MQTCRFAEAIGNQLAWASFAKVPETRGDGGLSGVTSVTSKYFVLSTAMRQGWVAMIPWFFVCFLPWRIAAAPKVILSGLSGQPWPDQMRSPSI